MEAGVAGLARPQRGHFELGTGYHGDLWLDLDALFLRPALLQPYVERLAEKLREHQVDAVCGPLEGGAFLALALATTLGVAFLPSYRATAGPGATLPGYRAAAGPGATPPGYRAAAGQATPPGYRLPSVPGGIGGWRVAVADDAVNAGTAIRACAGAAREHGAVPVAVAALLALGPAHAAVTDSLSLPLYAAGELDSQAWPAGACPLCASGAALTDPEG